jgi:aminotransferase
MSNDTPNPGGLDPADRLATVPLSGIRKVFDRVKELEAEGKDVIHWQIGRPDFDTPAHIKQAAADAFSAARCTMPRTWAFLPCARPSETGRP